MDLALEIFEKTKKLDEQSQYIILEVVSKFLGEDNDTLTDEDFKDIEAAREQRAGGEVYSWADIKKARVEGNGFDVLTDEDLHDIAIAEQELESGETISHSKRVWK